MLLTTYSGADALMLPLTVTVRERDKRLVRPGVGPVDCEKETGTAGCREPPLLVCIFVRYLNIRDEPDKERRDTD